jgi:membrane protein DedA with SNARE-associated domain
LFWDVIGEVLWVVTYVILGKIFSDRVQNIILLLGNLFWVEIGFIGVVVFGWILYRNLRARNK